MGDTLTLPPGFELDEPAGASANLPPGFELNPLPRQVDPLHGAELRAAPSALEGGWAGVKKALRDTVPHSLPEAAVAPVNVLSLPLRMARDVYQGARYGGQPSEDTFSEAGRMVAERKAFEESRTTAGLYDRVLPPMTSEDVASLPPEQRTAAAVAGAAGNVARELPRFFVTPAGVMTLMGGAALGGGHGALARALAGGEATAADLAAAAQAETIAQAGGRAVAGGFTADMGSGLPSQLEQSRQVLANPDASPLEKMQAALGPYATAVMVAGVAKHAATKGEPPTVARAVGQLLDQATRETPIDRADTYLARVRTEPKAELPPGFVVVDSFKPTEANKVELPPEQLSEPAPSVNPPRPGREVPAPSLYPEPLEGQPYDTRLENRLEAAMQTRPSAAPTPEATPPAPKVMDYGDMVSTPDGKVGYVRGGGEVGSGRVVVEFTDGRRLPYGRDELKLIQKQNVENLPTPEADAIIAEARKLKAEKEADFARRAGYRPEVEVTPEQQRIANGTKVIGDTALDRPAPAAMPETPVDTFVANMQPMAKAKAKAALDREVLNNGMPVTRRALVERKVEQGSKVVVFADGKRRLVAPDGSFLQENQISVTAMDYAEHLLAKDTAAKTSTPPSQLSTAPLSTSEISEFNGLEQQRRAGTLAAPAAARYRELEVRAGQGDFLAPQPKPLTPANVPTAAKVTPTQASTAANPKAEFNPKVAKEQKKFLLDAVDKALAEAPDTTRAEIQELWLASEHHKNSNAEIEWSKTDPRPEEPQSTTFGYTTEDLAKYQEAMVAFRPVQEAWKQRRDAALAPIAEPYLREMVGGADIPTTLAQGTKAAFYRSLPHVTIEVPGDGVFSILNTKDAIRDFKERAAKFPTTAARAKAPGSPRVNPTPVPVLGEPTKENIHKAAALAMSTDTSREVINTVWSDGKQTVATDGFRMHIFDKGIGGTEKEPVMLDAKGKPAVVDREYPNWKQLKPAEADLTKIFSGQDAAKLWTVLKQADAILDKEADISKSVKLWWNPDRTMGISSSSADVGAYEHNVNPKAKLVGALKPEFLMDALDAARKTGSEKVDVHWVDQLSPIVIRGDHVEAIIMPMRLTGPSPMFEPTMLNKYDLAKTPAEARAMMEKDLKALEDLRKPTGSDAVKADWLREQLSSVGDIGAEIKRLEAKRKKEAAKPRKTHLQKLDQETIDRELQARIDALKVRQKDAANAAELDKALEGNPDINTGALGESGMGGAKPGEFAQGQQTATGIKNATVDAERAKRGLPPAMEAARRDWGTVWDEAMARIDHDPQTVDRLIEDLKAKPRALTDIEDALLLHRQIDLQNEYGRATRDMAQAYEDSKTFPNRLEEVEAGKIRTAELSDRLLELYDVNKSAGTETGRGLAARKMMAYEDFSLAQMEMAERASRGGAPLTDAERAKLVEQQRRIAELEATAQKVKEQADQERATRMTDEAIADMKRELASRPTYDARIVRIAEEIVGKLEKQADKSRAFLKGKFLSPTPEDIYHLGVIGAAKIARLGLDFGKFSIEMAAEFGDGVKPYLQAAWERANLHLENEGAKYGDKAEPVKRLLRKRDAAGRREGIVDGLKKAKAEGQPLSLQGDYVRKLALSFVRGGLSEREALVDAVHQVLTKEIGLELTRRETMDAISGYGSYKPLDMDTAKALLRDLKGQMQQVAKLEDITAKKPLQKTGVERRSQSDEERRLIQQVNEAKRRLGVVVTDPARQLKSALAARVTALQHRKADLEYQIATRERIVKTKTPTPFDAETQLLEVQVEQLARQLDELVPRPGVTDEQRSAMAERSVERDIAVLEEQIKTGDVKAKAGRPIMATPKLEALKARREALRAERQELRALNPEYQAQAEARTQAALQARLATLAADYADRLARADFAPRVRKPVVMDAKTLAAQAAALRAKQAFQKGLALNRAANRTLTEKVLAAAVAWNRFSILSSPAVFMKLGTAAAWRMASTPVLEGIGSGIGAVLPGLAARAPRHGAGLNLRTEVKALTEGIVAGMTDAAKMMRTSETDLDVLYGKFGDAAGTGETTKLPPTWLDFWGHLHGAMKTFPKRAEFTRSLEKNLAWEATQGADVTQPGVQMRAALRAYKDAERAIFMQDNRVVGAYKAALRWMDQKDKATGETPLRWQLAGAGARIALPIVKVPSNIAAEIFEHVVGGVTGLKGAAKAYRKGLENVGPEEADAVLRQLKNGSLGGALLLLGFYTGAQYLGGMHVHNEKRDKADIKPNAGRVPGVEVFPWLGGPDIPKNAMHFPLISVAQMGATIARVSDAKLHKRDQDPQGLGAGAIAAALGLAEEVPFIREMGVGGSVRDPVAAAKTYVGDKVRSFLVPQLVQWTARQLDSGDDWQTTRRDPKTAADHIALGIPWMRNNVPEKVEKRGR